MLSFIVDFKIVLKNSQIVEHFITCLVDNKVHEQINCDYEYLFKPKILFNYNITIHATIKHKFDIPNFFQNIFLL